MIAILPLLLLQGAVPEVSPGELRRHVTYLASDELKGRGTPSPELIKAAEYIAAELKKVGVKPGVGESFFQETTYKDQPVRNVVGLIPGSDGTLGKEFVIVSAHYDHLGERSNVPGDDKIFNGANDDASGVAGMIGVAAALQKAKPKRSVILLAFYGEERGMVGSSFYVKNPVFPLRATVANLNIEQIGRTDDSEGPRISAASLTGFDFSTIGESYASVGKALGVPVTGHPQFSKPYFFASDNVSFARAGVPAHTICTAYSFADYHGAADHADKLDYANMAKVTRMIAATTLEIANAPQAPRWKEDQPMVAKYIEAWKAMQAEK